MLGERILRQKIPHLQSGRVGSFKEKWLSIRQDRVVIGLICFFGFVVAAYLFGVLVLQVAGVAMRSRISRVVELYGRGGGVNPLAILLSTGYF